MGKRGKRSRSKRKETKVENFGDGDPLSTTDPLSSKLTVTCHGGNFEPPVPFLATDLYEHEGLAPLRKSWGVLQKNRKTTWSPTPIQLQTWSIMLKKDIDLIGIAPTGSGKTYAYGLPLLSKISENHKGIQGMILVPTRELALQAEKDLTRTKTHVAIVAVYGGVKRETQLNAISSLDAPIIISATPGRLGDLLQDEKLQGKLSELKWIVMDEADRLATQVDMTKQVNDILEILGEKPDRRMYLFSATYPQSASTWNTWIGDKPHVIIKVNTVTVGQKLAPEENEDEKEDSKASVACEEEDDNDQIHDNDLEEDRPKKKSKGPLDLARIPANVTQTLHVCSAHKKPRKLVTTLQKVRPEKGSRQRPLCLIFFARIKTLQYISKMLTKDGVKCSELHSHLSQRDREMVLSNFQCGKVQILLATDVAARGIHVPNVDFVINYDFPISLEQYVHRCGRAGRTNERPATVYSFFTRELQPMAKDVMSLLQETNAWIDPNLMELAGEKGSEGKRSKKRNTQGDGDCSQLPVKKPVDEVDDDPDDGQFAYLNPNKIVLKRASHVSDASSESEDDSGE